MPRKPILCLDFDGVIHDYRNGWQNGEIYGDLTPGFAAWAAHARHHFKLVVYSSRSKDPDMLASMRAWMAKKLPSPDTMFAPGGDNLTLEDFEFAHEKPPAFLTIDDRAVRFDGAWDGKELTPEALLLFKPWTQRGGT